MLNARVLPIRALLPGSVGSGKYAGQKVVGPHEGFGIALEIDLSVLVEIALVHRDAGIENRIEPVALGTQIGTSRTWPGPTS